MCFQLGRLAPMGMLALAVVVHHKALGLLANLYSILDILHLPDTSSRTRSFKNFNLDTFFHKMRGGHNAAYTGSDHSHTLRWYSHSKEN
jgi:hypothetical protein